MRLSSRAYAVTLCGFLAVSATRSAEAGGGHERREPEAHPREHTVQDLPQPDSTDDRVKHWYGWQTLLLDAAALATMISSDSDRQAAGLGGYLASGPLVHLMHERPTTALASLGVRMASIVSTMLVIENVSCTDSYEGGEEKTDCSALFVGVVLSMLAAPIVDAAVFTAPDPQPYKRPSETTSLQFGVGLTPEALGVSAFGTF